MAKRAYKLQEFVAHSSNVNCLKIGKKSSRVLVTGGDDHKVNMWAIGKPNAILSLSGHSSAVESVTFDATEGLVVAGAASGTIKLWDLEEAKVVRTLNGHRSNCISVDYHPFGEFFASGSLDTNLKIWDIRRKSCIHTYKGHTRGINVLKFSPDGRWIVSGGEDNTVKLWDLTAGKLMHDFKSHEGQIQCLDFHPYEYLLATGSADRTVKFWDLETFEEIITGSGGPETSVVLAMTFNQDGRTLLSGLHESLKVFSWEPIRCHDAVDIGWSKLADLNVHEGKLLGCSYNQSCVGIWVVDLLRLGPYDTGNVPRANKLTVEAPKSNGHSGVQQLVNATGKNGNAMRPSSHGTELSLQHLKITPSAAKTESAPNTLQRDGPKFAVKIVTESSAPPTHVLPSRKSTSSRGHSIMSTQPVGRTGVVPVIVPRHSVGDAMARNAVKDVNNSRRTAACTVSSKINETITSTSGMDDSGRADVSSASMCQKRTVGNERIDQNFISRPHARITDSAAVDEIQGGVEWIGAAKFRRQTPLVSTGDTHKRENNILWPSLSDNDGCEGRMDRRVIAAEAAISAKVQHGRSCVVNASEEKKKNTCMDKHETINTFLKKTSGLDINSCIPKGGQVDSERECRSLDDLDAIESIMQQHLTFTGILQSRLTKLQAIRRFWEKTDIKGALEAVGKMGDHSVLVDVISVLNERNTVFTLEICAVILPLLRDLLKSEIDRYLNVALGTLLVLVRSFGDVIFATRNASPSVGVDIQAEERRERCNQCYKELEKVKQCLTSLIRRSGPVATSAQELRIILQDV